MSPRMLAELAYLYAVEAAAVEDASRVPDWAEASRLHRLEMDAWRQAQAGGYAGHGGADELFGARELRALEV